MSLRERVLKFFDEEESIHLYPRVEIAVTDAGNYFRLSAPAKDAINKYLFWPKSKEEVTPALLLIVKAITTLEWDLEKHPDSFEPLRNVINELKESARIGNSFILDEYHKDASSYCILAGCRLTLSDNAVELTRMVH